MSAHVLVTGGSGLLGRAILPELRAQGFDVVGLAYSRSKEGLVKCDLNSKQEIEKVLREYSPRVVIHAAAQRFPDQFDKDHDASYKLNVDATRTLAELCYASGIGVIQVSTDYVFDGNCPPYAEDAATNPINAYGVSKADAEKAVLEATRGSAIVLRIPVLYGSDEQYVGESAVSGLLKSLLDDSSTKKVSSYEVRRPSCTADIAFILGKLCAKWLEVTIGLRNVLCAVNRSALCTRVLCTSSIRTWYSCISDRIDGCLSLAGWLTAVRVHGGHARSPIERGRTVLFACCC